jgi:hypothetical protein
MTTDTILETTPSTSIIDVPFLVRGRVIEPGDDAVEFGGRDGGRFRVPDPAKYGPLLALSDAGSLKDLQDTPVDEIIEFLVELGPRLRLDDNARLQAAFELALTAGDLTEPLLRAVYSDMVDCFRPERLHGMVDKSIGKEYLDGWVERGAPGKSSVRIRATGTRQLHIIAGNVPIMPAITVIRCALTKSDCIIKMPSNDPYTAAAVVQAMIDLDPNHPVTKHFAVGYWKGGDEAVERKIIHPSRIEKLTVWGGQASMVHIQKYLVPGIELIPFNPKWSISIVGHEALESEAAMKEAAYGIAVRAGEHNQTGCSDTRVVYVESSTEEDDLERLEEFGHEIHKAFGELPEWFSTAPKRPNPGLDAELRVLELEEDFYRVIGDTTFGGVIVSRTPEPVEFADNLYNRIVNLVPLEDITEVPRRCNEGTQTVGVFPETLRVKLRDDLALYGVQRVLPLRREDGANPPGADPEQRYGGTHDGMEPLRRMVRWVSDESMTLH